MLLMAGLACAFCQGPGRPDAYETNERMVLDY